MRELDVLLMRYLERDFPTTTPECRQAFEFLLSCPDPDILSLLSGRSVAQDAALADVVQRLLAGPADPLRPPRP